MSRNEYYATVQKSWDGKYSAHVYYADGRVFMKNFLYNFKTKYKLLMELAALRVEVQ